MGETLIMNALANEPLLQGEVNEKPYTKSLIGIDNENTSDNTTNNNGEQNNTVNTETKNSVDNEELPINEPETPVEDEFKIEPGIDMDKDPTEQDLSEHGPGALTDDDNQVRIPNEDNVTTKFILNNFQYLINTHLPKYFCFDTAKIDYWAYFGKIPNAGVLKEYYETGNKTIEKTIKLTNGEVKLLEKPLSKVLEQTGIRVENPFMQLGLQLIAIMTPKMVEINKKRKEQQKQWQSVCKQLGIVDEINTKEETKKYSFKKNAA